MGRLKNLQLPAMVESYVRDTIPPTERLQEVSDFLTPGPFSLSANKPCTLALTDTALWIFHWTGQSERRKWRQSSSVAFNQIYEISTFLMKMPLVNRHHLMVRLSGASEFDRTRIFQSPYVEGDAFIKKFQQLLADHRSQPVSPGDELAKLSALAADGVLSPDEWDRAKELYLGKPPDARNEAVRLLRNLHEMQRNGILSEMEFNMKKWDVLSKL